MVARTGKRQNYSLRKHTYQYHARQERDPILPSPLPHPVTSHPRTPACITQLETQTGEKQKYSLLQVQGPFLRTDAISIVALHNEYIHGFGSVLSLTMI
jgi:hypothetical protein